MRKLLAFMTILFLISGCVETRPNVSAVNNRSEIQEKLPNITAINNLSDIPEALPVVDTAKNDLAKRLNISIEQVHVVKIEKVDWPDTSLGYREEGMMYAQVITPGFRIILKAGDISYEYHSDYKRIIGPVS
jgi:hypothetical protein